MEEGAIKSAVEFLTREYERGVGAFAQIPLEGYYREKPYTVTTSSCKSPRLTLFLFCATWSTYHGFFPTEHEPPSCARVGSNGAAGRSGIGGSRADPSRAEWSRVEPRKIDRDTRSLLARFSVSNQPPFPYRYPMQFYTGHVASDPKELHPLV